MLKQKQALARARVIETDELIQKNLGRLPKNRMQDFYSLRSWHRAEARSLREQIEILEKIEAEQLSRG